MKIKTFKEIRKEFDDVVHVNSMNGVPIQYISKVVNEMHEQRWVAVDDLIKLIDDTRLHSKDPMAGIFAKELKEELVSPKDKERGK